MIYIHSVMSPSRSVVEQQTWHAQHSKLRAALCNLERHWDFLAVLLLIAASMPVALLSPRTLPSLQTPNIDDSWCIDMCYKAVHGVWIGKGVFFTYGPVLQWLISLPVRWTGYSMGKAYATGNIVPMWVAFLLAALTLQMLLPEQPPWKRFVLLISLFIFWAAPSWFYPDMRPFAALFLFVLFLRGWYALSQQHLGTVAFGAGAALLCCAAFFVSADTGTYAVAGFLITFGGVALESGNEYGFARRALVTLGTFAVGCLILVLLVNTALHRIFDFTFWRASLDMVSAYRWFEPFPMGQPEKLWVIATLVTGAVVFPVRRVITPRGHAAITGRTGFLAAAFVYSLLGMQTALVRSDIFHVQMGIFPMVLFMGTILFGFEARTIASTVAVLVALTFCWAMVDPNTMYYSWSIKDRYSKIVHPVDTCAAGFVEFDRWCLGQLSAETFENAKRYIQQRTRAQDSILVFPWLNVFGSVTQRNVAGGVLLSYVASDGYLSDLDIRDLASAAPPAGLYFGAKWGWPVDNVPNFTRNTELWFWIQRHYRADRDLAPGILGLRADYSRADQVQEQAESLHLLPQTYPIVRESSTIDLGSPVWPSGGADFLRVRLRVHYPFWWKVRKPSHYELEITRADGNRKVIAFVLPPNQSTDVWFYPWDDDLFRFFASDETQWHAGPHPAITHLRLLVNPIDWVSIIPSAVSLDAVDAVRLTMR